MFQINQPVKLKLMSVEEVVQLIPGMTKGKLAQLRFTGKGPKYFKPTPRTVLYHEEEVLRWVIDSERQGTADVYK